MIGGKVTTTPGTKLEKGKHYPNLKTYDGEYDAANKITVLQFVHEDPAPTANISLSGTVKSYGDAGEKVTVTLTPTAGGTPLTPTLTGAAGTAPYSQNYTFAAVPAGTYTLKVEKKGHAPWTENITVGTDNITGKNVTIYLIGDVNRDGDVDLYDLLTLQQYLAKNITLTETQLLISDVTKDDKVDLYDLLTLQQYLARNITSFD